MNSYPKYEAFKHPPQLSLAELHMKCIKPGKDNPQGEQCPCCHRYEKLSISNWGSRDIIHDFKSYGGGVTAYFNMNVYMMICFLILSVCVSIYYIYVVDYVCDRVRCAKFISFLKFSSLLTIQEVLNKYGQHQMWLALQILLMCEFVILIAMTIGMRIYLEVIKRTKIISERKIYTKYSLVIKNISTFQRLDDVKKQLQSLDTNVKIVQLFFLYEIADFENDYRKLFDLHYEIEYEKKQCELSDDKKESKALEKMNQEYLELYEEVTRKSKRLSIPNGRAIVVFKDTRTRDTIYQKLKVNQFTRLKFYFDKLFKHPTSKINLYADPIEQPYQIQWKYIGESSGHKNKVRLETTVIGIGFMVICFIILYFPIVKVDQQRIQDNEPGIGELLSLLVSILLMALSISYRMILIKLIPTRKPSSRNSQSYFILFGTVVFHFFFYLVAPATYFFISKKIPDAIKIDQLFVSVLLFVISILVISLINLRMLIYNMKKKKLLREGWKKMCQIRLHEQLTYPSFPIQFKYMVILNLWAFNAFYAFVTPYITIIFFIFTVAVYWIDKYNIYNLFKTQHYQSIDLQLSFQRVYIFVWILSVCGGFAMSVVDEWQYFFMTGVAVFAIILDFGVEYYYKMLDRNIINVEKSYSLEQVIKSKSGNQSMRENIFEADLKEQLLVDWDSLETSSLGSISLTHGYKQIYEKYISQFKNKAILDILQKKYRYIKLHLDNNNVDSSSIKSESPIKKRQSQLVSLPDLNQRKTQSLDPNYLITIVKGIEHLSQQQQSIVQEEQGEGDNNSNFKYLHQNQQNQIKSKNQ